MITALVSLVGAWQRRSVHRTVLSAAATVAVFTLAARLAGAGKEMVVAWRFGTSDEVDAFLLAFLVPAFAISVIGGSLNSALVPAYVETREREGQAAAQRLLSTTLTLSVALLAVSAVALGALIPALLPWIAPSYSPAKLRLVRELTWALMPCLVVAGTSMTWTAVLNAHGRFAAPAAAALATPTVAVAALLALPRSLGIGALAAGLLLGYCGEACLVGRALRREGLSIWPRWSGLTPSVRRVVGQFAPLAAGMTVTCTNPVTDSIMAAALGAGSVASLGYGNKLVSFALGIGSASLGSAVLPHFSRLAAGRDWDGLRRTVRLYAAAVFATSAAVTAAAFFLSEPIVRLLFERGAFTRADTLQVARIQAFYFLQFPFHMTGILFVRLISAAADNRALLWISIVNAVVNVAANWVFSRFLGVAGIALSTSLVYLISCLLAVACARRRLRLLGSAEWPVSRDRQRPSPAGPRGEAGRRSAGQPRRGAGGDA